MQYSLGTLKLVWQTTFLTCTFPTIHNYKRHEGKITAAGSGTQSSLEQN